MMKQQFTEARAKLESNPVAHGGSSKSGDATAEVDVIDLISQSIASLQKSQPSVLPGSPISVASTPSHVGNGGRALGFLQLSSGSHPLASPATISHDALEAKRASALFWTQFQGCPHMDIPGASLPHLYGGQ